MGPIKARSLPRSRVFSMASSRRAQFVRSRSASSEVFSESLRGQPGPRARATIPQCFTRSRMARSWTGVMPQRPHTSASLVFFRDASRKTCHFCSVVNRLRPAAAVPQPPLLLPERRAPVSRKGPSDTDEW